MLRAASRSKASIKRSLSLKQASSGTGAFTKESSHALPELQAEASLFRHNRTGATLLSISAPEDSNKVFGATFRTATRQSTGVAHILEHSVLAGSKRYPLREPFVEILRGSMYTFLNAMTYPCRTVYPVASPNEKDFYNLASVYADAVVNPLIDQDTFRQEGWSWALESESGPLKRSGVVYNEMKGVYSDPDAVMYRATSRLLFPDSVYAFDSGGDPATIPDLSWAQMRAFHAERYHPQNGLFFFYGDDAEEKRLAFLDEHLEGVPDEPPAVHGGPDPEPGVVDVQPQWDAPRAARRKWPVSHEGENGFAASANWVTSFEAESEVDELEMSIVDACILSNHGAPLREALLESGLGDSIIGGGYGPGLLQPTFSVGLRGVKGENVDAVNKLVLSTLEKVSDDSTGLVTARAVEAAMQSTEFSLREMNTGGAPRGLAVMLALAPNWTYGRDLLGPLRINETIEELRKRMAPGGDYEAGAARVRRLVRERLVDNTHRLDLVMEPDRTMLEVAEANEAADAQARLEKMPSEERESLVKATAELKARQMEQDDPEALAALPQLRISDLDRTGKRTEVIPRLSKNVEGVTVPAVSSGIAYVNLSFDMSRMPHHLLPYVPLVRRALTRFGTTSRGPENLGQEIDLRSGGIGFSFFNSARMHDAERGRSQWDVLGNTSHRMLVKSKMLYGNVETTLDLVHEMVTECNLDQRSKVAELLRDRRSSFESSAAGSGNSVARSILNQSLGRSAWIDEQLSGLAGYRTVCRLQKEVEEDWEGMLQRLQATRDAMFSTGRTMYSVGAEAPELEGIAGHVEACLERFPFETKTASWGNSLDTCATPVSHPSSMGLALSSSVNYVGSMVRIPREVARHGSASVAGRLLSTGWLWENVRVLGGAYGCSASVSPASGAVTFTSYRDPNTNATLQAYTGAASFLESDLSEDLMRQGVVGTIGSTEAPLFPDQLAMRELSRHMLGTTEDHRQEWREQVLDTSSADMKRFAEALRAGFAAPSARVAIVGAKDALTKVEAGNIPDGDALAMDTLSP